MKATDARRYSPAQLEILRERGLALRAEGRSAIEIGKVLGVCRGTVYKWLKKEEETSTEQAIKGGKRGRPLGACKVLTTAQEVEIQKFMTERNPLQLKFDFALWTRRDVRALIRRLYGVEMPMTTVGCYLRSWGMTPQRPSRRAIERNNEKVQLWLNEQYPAIANAPKLKAP